MLAPVHVIVMLVLQAVPVAVAGAFAGAWWARRRAEAEAGWRLERVERRLAGLEARLDGLGADRDGPERVSAPGLPHRAGRLRADRPTVASPSPGRPPVRAEAPEGAGALPPALIAVPDLSGTSRPPGARDEPVRRSSGSSDLARRFARIWELADRGAPAERIAAATGQPIGQVELVLNLRRRLLDDPAAEVPA